MPAQAARGDCRSTPRLSISSLWRGCNARTLIGSGDRNQLRHSALKPLLVAYLARALKPARAALLTASSRGRPLRRGGGGAFVTLGGSLFICRKGCALRRSTLTVHRKV